MRPLAWYQLREEIEEQRYLKCIALPVVGGKRIDGDSRQPKLAARAHEFAQPVRWMLSG